MSTSQSGGWDYPHREVREYPPPEPQDDRESDSPASDDSATRVSDYPGTGGHLSGSGYTTDTYSNTEHSTTDSAYPSEPVSTAARTAGPQTASQGPGYPQSSGYGTAPRYGTEPGLPSAGYGASYGDRPMDYPSGTDYQTPASGGQRDQSTTDVAKEQAGRVADHAVGASKDVVQTAHQQAGAVANEARWQARQLLHQAQSEVSNQAATQQQRLAGGLHQVADQLHSMASRSDQQGMVTDLAREAADRTHRLAGWLDDRDPNGVLDEVRSFARRRPGAFLAVALGAGLLAGRLARNMAADPDELARQHRQGGSGTNGVAAASSSYQPGAVAGSYPPGGYDPYDSGGYQSGRPLTTPAASGALPPAAGGAAPLTAPPYGTPVTGGPVTDTGTPR